MTFFKEESSFLKDLAGVQILEPLFYIKKEILSSHVRGGKSVAYDVHIYFKVYVAFGFCVWPFPLPVMRIAGLLKRREDPRMYVMEK